MSPAVRVAALELPASWGDVDGALDRVDALLSAAPFDLALLPEASLTGYVSPRGVFDPTPMAEPRDGPTHRRLAELARAHRAFVSAPIIERAGAHVFNAFCVVAPSGETVAWYRKRHPWIPETWATPGDLPYPRFEACGLTWTLAVCYDVHFIAREASDVLASVDVLLFPSAWVEEGDDTRPPILGDLARRFGITAVNANWAAGVVRAPGQGRSRVVYPGREGVVALKPGRLDVEVARKIVR